ncbi:MAG: efflux RND transporter periplasmic adaptor subunit [Bacteroidales bacterium]
MDKTNLIKGVNLLIISVLSICLACTSPKKKDTRPSDIKVVEVMQQDVVDDVDFVGEVYGCQDISIRARVVGYLEGIHFKEGFPVKKGQLLYTIDEQAYRAEVASKQSLLAEAQSRFAKAKNDLERYKPLAETRAVSQADLDAAKLQYEAAESMVKAAKANLEISKINLSYTRIHSPIDGIIGKSLSDVGELVGQYPNIVLNTVSKMDEIFVEFFLPENEYLRISKRVQSLGKETDSSDYEMEMLELVLADGSVHKQKGFITFVDRGVNRTTGTILVQTRFANPDNLIRPGQFAKVRVPLNYKNAVLVPQKCVKELQGQFSAFVVNDENRIETRQLTLGATIGDLWRVKDGLKPNEKVVIEGLQKVRNDMEVTPKLVEFKSQISTN